MRRSSRLAANLAATVGITAITAAAIILGPTIARGQQPGGQQPAAGGAAKAEAGGEKVTYDKSLAPDGKPWTGTSLIKYWKSKRPELNFTLVKRLEVEVKKANGKPTDPPKLTPKEAARARREAAIAKRKGGKAAPKANEDDKPQRKAIVYSETPARTQLLEKISEQFKVQPDRAIVDFAGGREAAYETMNDRYPAYFSEPPSSFSDDTSAQKIHWIKAVEIIDFRGNEQAARAYFDEFAKAVRLAPMRLGSVVVTGDAFYVRDIDTIMAGGILPPIDGKGESAKVAGYKGYPVNAPSP